MIDEIFLFVSLSFQNVNNLAYYAAYLPVTVESNLRPITQSTPVIFQNCVNTISSGSDKFDEILERCKNENVEIPTVSLEPGEEPTTQNPEEGSGFELSQSYILA